MMAAFTSRRVQPRATLAMTISSPCLALMMTEEPAVGAPLELGEGCMQEARETKLPLGVTAGREPEREAEGGLLVVAPRDTARFLLLLLLLQW